jgi:hypothetical protein
MSIPHAGRFKCPHCDQIVEAAEASSESIRSDELPGRAAKKEVDNGIGWWTAVKILAWIIFVLPGVAAIIVAIFSVYIGSQNVELGGVSVMVALSAGIGGAVFIAIGWGLMRWGISAEYTLVCGDCGNPATKTSILCPACKANFHG